jgi:hypothetical protein
MNARYLPAVNYHSLVEIIQKDELKAALGVTTQELSRGHITAIVNAFFKNTQISTAGIPYIMVKGIAPILRTTNSGAERSLIYRGINGLAAASEVIEINGSDYISGPSLAMLLQARILLSDTRTRLYLDIAMELYDKIVRHRGVRDMRDLYLSNIENKRPFLKMERISRFGITKCEFSGVAFTSVDKVEFAHIESVVTAPFRALDVTNGVIILKTIHTEMTNQRIHDYEEMYSFCQKNNYSTEWAARI